MTMIYDQIPFVQLVQKICWKLRAYCAYLRKNIYDKFAQSANAVHVVN